MTRACGLFRKVEAVALDIGVGRIQQRQIVLVAAGNVVARSGSKVTTPSSNDFVRPTSVMP